MATSPQKIVIVGAGPAGLLFAHYLLHRRSQQYQVEIYDRRPDPRQVAVSERRSFPISLQERGLQGLRGIPDLEAAIAQQSLPCQGTVVHNKQRSREIRRQNTVLAIDRNTLVLVLLEELSRRYAAPQVQLRFNHACETLDAAAQTVCFKTPDSQESAVHYDRLIGADGAGSQVRDLLAAHHGLQSAQALVPDAYKSIFLARTNPDQGIDLANNRIHTANLNQDVRIVLAPQPGDRLHGAFVFNAEKNPFADLTTPTAVQAYFAEHLPTFGALLSDAEAQALLERPVARLTTITCDRFHEGDRILLVGDAAHAVSPSIGQGCNSALEDIVILNQLLDRYDDDWAQVLPQFSQQRVPDAHALRDLSDYAFPRTPLLVLEFFLRLTLGRKLHQWFPQQFQPFVFDLVLDTNLSYAEVLRRSSGWINKVKRSMTVESPLT
ncbi:MAG: FAD-dependent monooxygenase [Spirulina sp. SIO3F2]|nr:FAD-dependent monooxygenase [Spirulina sp. SIO3F2]